MVRLFAGSGSLAILLQTSLADPNQQKQELKAQRLRGSFPHSAEMTLLDFLQDTDPFADIARSGLDRSLSSIHIESELNIANQEQLNAVAGFISDYSRDGNDDAGTCPFDYEGDVDPFHSSIDSKSEGRSLQMDMDMGGGGHHDMHYVESSCNAMLSMANCTDWSDWLPTAYLDNIDLVNEIKIPCGECVTLNASPGQPMYGQLLEFGEGLNIVGKLVIPSDADIEITAKYVFVQGELVIPAPTAATDLTNGPKVRFTLYGTDDITFQADPMTDNAHHMGKNLSAKPFVVAGGKVDIRAMEPTCPSWIKLQSIQYGAPLPNIALNKTSTQIDTFRNFPTDTPDKANDGIRETFSHTECTNNQPWWEVDLGDRYTISSLNIVNRLDCCGGRLHDFYIRFYDENKVEVDSILHQGHLGNEKSITADLVEARYVKIHLTDTDCLQLGEVEVYGWLSAEGFPEESLDILTVGEDAARCWNFPTARLMITPDTHSWDDVHVVTVAETSSPAPGTIPVLPLPKKKTAADETFGFPDFAVEVALIDRSVIIEGAAEDPSSAYATLGGHFIVLHTPHVHQHVEGVLLQNMGQAGKLGRYPLHFHMSECVHGSTLAKNVIYKSNQRCVVVHGTHNVTVSNNVAYDTKGHCFMLEDGGEFDNTFEYNLGALTKSLPVDQPQAGETDHRPATFWITNPSNHFVGNVAAGSFGTGFWFELKLRGPSAQLPIALENPNPKVLPLGSFIDNTAHSNRFRAGITTYETGYLAPPNTIWINTKSYKNRESGLFQHGTTNIYLQGGILADNQMAAHNFHHDNAVYDNVDIIGRSQHVQSMIDEGRISADCGKAGGVSIQPNEGLKRGTVIKNSRFSGFNNECSEGKNRGIFIGGSQVRNAVFDSSPTFVGNTFADTPLEKRISACIANNTADDGWVRYIAVEDVDGSLSGIGPGFFIQDEPAITSFIDTSSCQAAGDSCLLFCPGACLRLGIVSISQDLTTRGFNMQISADGTNSAAVARGPIWFNELQNHLSAPMPIVLPEPSPATSFQISFTDKNNDAAWPGYASLSLEDPPTCAGGLQDASQIDFVMPDPSIPGRCDDLFKYDDYANGVHGWQHFFAGLQVTEVGGQVQIKTTTRTGDGGHVNLSRTLDVSCIVGNSGQAFTLFGKIRLQDKQGTDFATDGTSGASPKITFLIKAGSADLMRVTWFQSTSSDGTWSEFKRKIFLPADTSAATKAQIIIDQATGKEFLITEWGMVMSDPTDSPSSMPSLAPSISPSLRPSLSSAPFATDAPATAAPVAAAPTNLALNGLASASTECWAGYASKAFDGNTNTINHSCCKVAEWIMTDLGLNTLNYIQKVVVVNRGDCCGGRTREFHIDVLDGNQEVVYTEYYGGRLGNGAVKEFVIDNGTAGRFVRLRFNENRQDCLHVAEMEVWGYPVQLPATQPEIIEMSVGKVATASSVYGNRPQNDASHGNDGQLGSIYHSDCKDAAWWKVDLGSVSFIQDVVLTNRVDCCGGRLRNAWMQILDENENIVDQSWIQGPIGNGQIVSKVFNLDTSIGRYVKIQMTGVDCLHFANFEVHGYHL